MQRGYRVLLIVGAAGLVAQAAGCGSGGGDSGSTTRTLAGRTITVPSISTTATRTAPTTTGTVPSTLTLPTGQTIRTSQLTPFRDCLRRHGVQPLPLNAPPPRPPSEPTHAQQAHLLAE